MKLFVKLFLFKILPLVIAAAAQSAVLVILIGGFFGARVSAAVLFLQYFIALIGLIFIVNSENSSFYKLGWLVTIALFPLLGSFLYILIGRKTLKKRIVRRIKEITQETQSFLEGNFEASGNTLDAIDNKLIGFVRSNSGYPAFASGGIEYYPDGIPFKNALFKELRNAESFIFMEFYQLKDGSFLNSLLDILKEKAAEGVKIRIIFDGAGSFNKLKSATKKELRKCGIYLQSYNPPAYSSNINVRDHRKIVAIDGKTAFTGGFNINDESINLTKKYGYWRDTAIKVTAEAARSFTVMFLRMWQLLAEKKEDISLFLKNGKLTEGEVCGGFIQPFTDGPGAELQLHKAVFLDLIRNSEKHLYISTPYLILDDETLSAIINAARGGTDVRILTPHIPDKKLVFNMTRSYYPALLNAGVKIYEFKDGFNHAKMVSADGLRAYAGSCNLDYRSFCLQYECGAVMYGCAVIETIEKDYLGTLEKCVEVKVGDIDERGFKNTFYRLISPMF